MSRSPTGFAEKTFPLGVFRAMPGSRFAGQDWTSGSHRSLRPREGSGEGLARSVVEARFRQSVGDADGVVHIRWLENRWLLGWSTPLSLYDPEESRLRGQSAWRIVALEEADLEAWGPHCVEALRRAKIEEVEGTDTLRLRRDATREDVERGHRARALAWTCALAAGADELPAGERGLVVSPDPRIDADPELEFAALVAAACTFARSIAPRSDVAVRSRALAPNHRENREFLKASWRVILSPLPPESPDAKEAEGRAGSSGIHRLASIRPVVREVPFERLESLPLPDLLRLFRRWSDASPPPAATSGEPGRDGRFDLPLYLPLDLVRGPLLSDAEWGEQCARWLRAAEVPETPEPSEASSLKDGPDPTPDLAEALRRVRETAREIDAGPELSGEARRDRLIDLAVLEERLDGDPEVALLALGAVDSDVADLQNLRELAPPPSGPSS